MFESILQRIEEINIRKLEDIFSDVIEEGYLASPDIRPQADDRTVPDWLDRIETWGKITYYHKNPEKWWGKRKVTRQNFIDHLTDEELNKMFGRWSPPEKKGLTKCIMRRSYTSFTGKKYTEVFIIDVKLSKELQ